MQRRSKWALGVLGLLAVGAILAARLGLKHFGGEVNALHLDLGAPDGYIATPALSRLPRDLVKAPLAKDLLTEDFAFYYEDHPDRLGVAGALKRIAFEHETTVGDRLLQVALDEPAEVALWTDTRGAPRYWLVAMTRGVLAKTLQELGPLLAGDSQLSELGELPGASGATRVIALTLSPHRTLALVARGDRVVVLSDPGLLFDDAHHADASSAHVIASLLSGNASDQAVLRQRFGLGAPGADHVIVADSSLLSFGYRHFFPGLQALRIDVPSDGSALRAQLRVADAKSLPSAAAATALWSGLPTGPAACSWLPVDWTRARDVLGEIGADEADAAADAGDDAASQALPATGKSARDKKAKPARPKSNEADDKLVWDHFVASLDGPAAVCWYARSQFHTPLLVARTRADAPAAATDAALARIAAWLMPTGTAVLPANPRVPGARRWQAEVTAPYGPYGQDDTSLYHPTLSHQGAWIAFSPDDTLVELALFTQARRYPSVADTLPAGGVTLAVVAPPQVADLVQREAFAVLPPQQELFRQAAKAHLVPRLDAMRRWPAVSAVATGTPSAQGWVPISWVSTSEMRVDTDAPSDADASGASATPRPAARRPFDAASR